MAKRYNARSISMPCRSHPTTLKIEQKLYHLNKTWEETTSFDVSSSSAASICCGLSGLADLYNCMDELLNNNSTQRQLLLNNHHPVSCNRSGYLEELLEVSMKLLDVCSIARDMVVQAQEQSKLVSSALRRRRMPKGDATIRINITNYICFRKKMKKDSKKLITTLKQMDEKFGSSTLLQRQHQLNLDHQMSAAIRVLTQVCVVSIFIFKSLLLFLTDSSVNKPKVSKWSMVSKWVMHKGVIACELDNHNHNVNEFDSVDHALSTLDDDDDDGVDDLEKARMVQKRMEALEVSAHDLENGLESLFRRLIKTRARLLNILSQ